jgi:hypothetical protein
LVETLEDTTSTWQDAALQRNVHVKNALIWLVLRGGLFPLFSAQFAVMIGRTWEGR